MHKLRFFFDIKFSGKHAGRCFQLFQISVFPDPRIASVPIDGTGTGITRPLIDLILIRRLRDQCLHKDFVRAKGLVQHLQDPLFFCQQIPCKAVRAAEPVAALCEVNVLIALYFQQLLARQQDSIDHAEHRMAAQIDILEKVPVINALIVEWAERVRVEMDKFHVRVCLKKCTDIFLCLNGQIHTGDQVVMLIRAMGHCCFQ